MNIEQVRREFPICQEKIYLDSALYNSGSLKAQQALQQYFAEGFSGVLRDKSQWYAKVAEVKQRLSVMLEGINPSGIAITKNTVEGINLIAQGFPWQVGDQVIITDQEHTSNTLPWLALKNRGVEVCVLEAVDHCLPIELFEKAIQPRTRIISVSHIQSPTGYKTDLKELGQLCRKHGVFLVTDAIQSIGVSPILPISWGIDGIAAGAHKGMLGIPGVGFLWLSPALLSLVAPSFAGASGVCRVNKQYWTTEYIHPNDARKFELSNLNFPGLYAMSSGLELIEELGLPSIYQHLEQLNTRLQHGLLECGYHLATPIDTHYRGATTSIDVEQPDLLRRYLAEHNIQVSKVDSRFVRFSVGVFNQNEDIDTTLAVLKNYR